MIEKNETVALISSALDDAKHLLTLETQLVRLELSELTTRARSAGNLMVVGLCLVIPASVMATLAMGRGLHVASGMADWACYAIVSVAEFFAAAAAFWSAKRVWNQSRKETSNGTETRTLTTGNSSYQPVASI